MTSTIFTIYGQMSPPAIYIFVDFIILVEAIYSLIYTMRADGTSRLSRVINIVYNFLAPTPLLSDCLFFSIAVG